jgi:beta-lactamase superfamily II metal-dependent hydrolase
MQRRAVPPLTTFLTLLLSGSLCFAKNISGKIEVHYIDVGQADVILVMSPNKEWVMLIDSGDTRYPGSSKNFRTYLTERLPKDHAIDLMVASHSRSDRIGEYAMGSPKL